MKATPETQSTPNNTKRNLILVGALLTVGWALFLASSNLISGLSCAISPNACSQGADLAKMIAFAPIVVGSLLISTGMVYDKKGSWLLKLPYIIVGAAVICFLSFWLVVFALISFHGFGA